MPSLQIVLGKPQPKQREMMLAHEKYVLFGGARGGGKSWTVREKAKRLAIKWAGIKILIIRKTYVDLRDNHILPLRAELPDAIAPWKEADKSFVFINKSRIKCSYFANEADALQFQGQEYDVIFLEEATQFPESVFTVLKACLRGANNFPKRIYLTCNPDGIGFQWVKRLFISREYVEGEKAEDYRFIQSLVTDNEILLKSNPDYLAQLDSLPPGMRERWRYGSWDCADGQYFPEFRRDLHVCDPFPIPSDWRRYRAFDYGLDRFACLWIAISPSREVFVYREVSEPNLRISDAAARALDMTGEGEEIYCTLAPPDMWSRSQESGKSKADLFQESGLTVVRSSNDREAGWLSIKELLAPVSDGKPRLQIFRNCTDLIRCIPALLIDEKKPTDCSTEPHEFTHAPDALRYFAVYFTRPNEIEVPKPKATWSQDLLEDYYSCRTEDERKYMIAKFGNPF